MNTPTIVVIIVAVIIVAAVAVMAIRTVSTTRHLKGRYGDEYDRAITEHGGRAAAEAELRRRIRAHQDLTLTDFSAEQVEQYRSAWTALQAQFIDDPTSVVRAADHLVAKLVSDRGYPVVEFDERVRQLSVEHAGVLDAYREAHTAAERSNAGWASTEDLRRALVSYRNVMADVLGDSALDPASADLLVDAPADVPAPVPTVVATDAPTAVTTEAPAAVSADVTDAETENHVVADGGSAVDDIADDGIADDGIAASDDAADELAADDTTDVATTIPTVDGAPPTAADLSANEGYVTANTGSRAE